MSQHMGEGKDPESKRETFHSRYNQRETLRGSRPPHLTPTGVGGTERASGTRGRTLASDSDGAAFGTLRKNLR